MFSIALFDSVRANLNETSDQLNSLSALPEIMHLYRYSKFSSLLTSLSRQGKFQLIILQSLSTPFPDLSLARRIRQYDRRVPIIIVTDNESLCLEGYDVPIFQFYTKAMTVQQMRMVLECIPAGVAFLRSVDKKGGAVGFKKGNIGKPNLIHTLVR